MAQTPNKHLSEDQETPEPSYCSPEDDQDTEFKLPDVWEVSPGVYYIGQTSKDAQGRRIRQGTGTQVVLDEEGEEFVRYQGEWKGDKPGGKGVLLMGGEEYRGEFYLGEPNGSG